MTEKRSRSLPPLHTSESAANDIDVIRTKLLFDINGNEHVEQVLSHVKPTDLFAEDFSLNKLIAAGVNPEQTVLFASQSKFNQVKQFN